MDLLVLGGTLFLGRHVVAQAIAAGHRVSLFTRGKTNPALFPDAERLHGDRDGALDALAGRRWDAVIDTSGFVPRVVRQSAELLRDAADHYTFVSTISVYASFDADAIDEDAPLATLADPTVEEVTGETYGGLKVQCERVVQDVFGERALIVRPGLIVGPFDPTDRFTYWSRRIARGGAILAPQGPDKTTQFIDVRDLAAWMLALAESRASGVFNATSAPVAFGAMLDAGIDALGVDATVRWVDERFLLDRGVEPWSDLPMWIPDGSDRGLLAIDVARATAAGLRTRSLAETIADTNAWDVARGAPPLARGLTAERERDVLEAWSATRTT